MNYLPIEVKKTIEEKENVKSRLVWRKVTKIMVPAAP